MTTQGTSTVCNPETVFGGYYFFGADRLFRTDGTVAGTTALGSFTSVEVHAALVQGILFTGVSGARTGLWVSDASGSKTTFLGSVGTWADAAPIDDQALFLAYELGYQLWITDGAPTGTREVITGATVQDNVIFRAGDYVYFTESDSIHGTDPWRCPVD